MFFSLSLYIYIERERYTFDNVPGLERASSPGRATASSPTGAERDPG